MLRNSSAYLKLLGLASLWANGHCSPAALPEAEKDANALPYQDRQVIPRAPVTTAQSCTWTISLPDQGCPFWNSIETVYPSTAIRTAHVDCHGCQDVLVTASLRHCPNMHITATEFATTPSVTWTTACATSTAAAGSRRRRGPAVAVAAVPAPTPVGEVERREPQLNLADQNPAACPTTYVLQPAQTAGSTATRYQQTVTETVKLPCGGCSLVVSTALLGYGPPGRFTTTTTLPLSTATAYACQ
jgi:hypothetical protein